MTVPRAVPPPDRVEFDLPVDAEAVVTFSPLRSRSYTPAAFGQGAEGNISGSAEADERAPLLGTKKERKPFYRPRPLWIVPFALLSSIARGMTLAPRVQVYTQLSCNALHRNYNHTNNHLESILFPASTDSIVRSYSPLTHVVDYSMPLPILFPDLPTAPQKSVRPIIKDPSKACVGDPAVQAGAARLQTAVMVTMGILSALTTSFWGHWSEKNGRTKVLAGSSLGLFVIDLAFLLAIQPSTSTFHIAKHVSPHLLILTAPVIEGLLGGWTTLTAATSAYISDCTSDGSRASVFSRFAGISYMGLALGPVVGATIMRYTAAHPSVVKVLAKGVEGPTDGVPSLGPVFTIAIICTVINFFLSVFLFPESVHKARLRAAAKLSAAEDRGEAHEALPPKQVGFAKRLFGPLAVFAPSKTLASASGRVGRDWSLTWLALGLLCVLLSAGIFQIKYLFAEHVYGWDSEQLSYYVTYAGGLRAMNMLFLMPFIITHFKPKASGPVSTPADAFALSSRVMAFDLRVARTAVFLDILSHGLVLLPITNGPITFCAFTGLSSIAAAVVPTAQSVALSLFNRNPRNVETGVGALFGAMSAIQAIGQMIIGPLLFGMVYSASVATFPKAIFALACGLVTASFCFLLLIRSAPIARKTAERKGKDKVRPPTQLGKSVRERGRSRAVKHVGDRETPEDVIEPSSSGSGASLSVGSPALASTSAAIGPKVSAA
ncbi:major facilitator superfamily domain-containing protein [Vararia minispora EC-137]|uniref:Major facilitator superfamily domain-containing protein n=1 Tax=Vararia minispora EC-137 TaxID=1314806 RepID=A0ACB8QEU6_9AGAM|nr:major facilitator superfamily domain-containing protein [Vararia minispora EC-137]